MKIIKTICIAITATALIACGGGGGGGSTTAGTSEPVAFSLQGVAAVGAPIVNGVVTVACATGDAPAATNTSSTGAWKVTLSRHTLPCAAQVSGGTINGVSNTTLYHSIALTAGTVNITPLTDLMVANITAARTPSVWFAGLQTSGALLNTITQAQVTAALNKMAAVLTALKQLASLPPMTTAFEAVPGNAMDNMLAALRMAMANASVTHDSLLGSAVLPAFGPVSVNFNNALTQAYAFVLGGTGGQTTSGPGILGVMPIAGKTGSPIAILGTNFAQVPGDILSGARYQVSFNGAVATPVVRTLSQLSIIVPAGATTGPLTVTDLQTGQVYNVPGGFTVTGSGPVFVAGKFMAIPAGGNFTSPDNDVEFGFIDLVGANVSITSTDITVSMTVRDLPATLAFNQANVPLNYLEYAWGVDFDLNGDDIEDYSLSMSQYKFSGTPTTQAPLAATQKNVWKTETNGSTTYLVGAQASVSGNTITLKVLKSANAELAKITPAAKVRISTTYRNSADTFYTDFIR